VEHIELLRPLYGHVVVPEPVAKELSTAGAPAIVREWIVVGSLVSDPDHSTA
jgi:predicted nucleic acid-binding protein